MTTARTTDLAATADRYLTALNEADPATRRRLIGEAWTPEGSLLDPPLAGQGYDGLAEVGDQLHAGYPGHRFTRTSEVDGHHDRIRFSWALLDPAGEPVLTGIDVAVVAPDGRVAAVTGFFGDRAAGPWRRGVTERARPPGRLQPPPAGALLREWRARRRLSQLDLATLAGTSSRHLSYVETGRSTPSREMVLRLADTLALPLAACNQVLLGAGHAPAYQDARADPAATRRLLETLDLALAAYEPWPALVLDAAFDVVVANAAVDRLLALVDPDLLDPPVNVIRLTLHPRGLSRHITNLGAWRAHLLRQLRQHAAAAPSPDLSALLAEAERWPAPAEEAPSAGPSFALPLELSVGGQALRLYSTVATFGTPLDVAASELAIETFLPADDTTRLWLSAAAQGV